MFTVKYRLFDFSSLYSPSTPAWPTGSYDISTLPIDIEHRIPSIIPETLSEADRLAGLATVGG